MLIRGGRKYGFDVEFQDAPSVTRSMRIAMADLELERLFVVVPSERSFAMDDRIDVVGIRGIPSLVKGL